MPAETRADDRARIQTECAGPNFQTRAPLIELEGVEKMYRMGKVDYPALRGVDLSIVAGEMVAVVGPSGSGKTTILNLITGIDRPSAGAVTVDGKRLDEMSEEELAVWRGANVGLVFQFFPLLRTLSALENAIARSLAADPRLIVGDEPTGNLDSVTADEMFELLERLNREGKTILFVTHDRELAARAQRVVTIRDGVVVPG